VLSMKPKSADVWMQPFQGGPFEGFGQVKGVAPFKVEQTGVLVRDGLEGPLVVPRLNHRLPPCSGLLQSLPTSGEVEAAVHVQDGAGDVGAVLRAQEGHCARHVCR
jgi:hypothetical protein